MLDSERLNGIARRRQEAEADSVFAEPPFYDMTTAQEAFYTSALSKDIPDMLTYIYELRSVLRHIGREVSGRVAVLQSEIRNQEATAGQVIEALEGIQAAVSKGYDLVN